MSLPAKLAIIDLETTGGNPVKDRITEIAVIRVEDGVEVSRWQSLVRPGVPIPALIQGFTGITDAMVADAPSFAELADEVRALLADCVFVAHNARFDYGFIKQAYAALGSDFEAPVLCTVKLSRALNPEHHRHGLDALIARHALPCDARHRAMGDTQALHAFLELMRTAHDAETMAKAVAKAMKAPNRPHNLPEGALDGLPDNPGVFLFYAESGAPLLVGRSLSLRARVMDYFSPGNRKAREQNIARDVRRVEWIETPGELSALLLEAAYAKRYPAACEHPPQGKDQVFGLRYRPGRKHPPIFQREPLAGTDPATWGEIYGPFRHKKEADQRLYELALNYRLCPRRLGLEDGSQGPCTAYHQKRCAGVCAGKESPAEHDERLLGALATTRLKPWPWSGPVLVSECAPERHLERHHLLDQWCVLGSADSHAELDALLAAPPARAFDLDLFRLLLRWFENPAHRDAVREL